MKKTALLAAIIPMFFACKKNSSTGINPITPASTSTIVTAIYTDDVSDRQLQIDSFTYDGNKRLAGYFRIGIDSTQTPVSTVVLAYTYSYTGNDTLPSSYTIEGGGSQAYLLTYDSNKNIILDSCTTIHNSYYYDYRPDTIITTQQTVVGNYVDTLLFDNGNMISTYYSNNFILPPQPGIVTNFTYSSYANPLYMFKNIGALLYTTDARTLDFLSKKLYSQITAGAVLSSQITWTADNNGRVVSGTGTYSPAGALKSVQFAIHYQ